MKDYQIDQKNLEFTATIDYGTSGIIKASYDITPLAHFVTQEMDEEMLAESCYNEIAENIKGAQLNLSQLYITVLEFIKDGKIAKQDINHWDNLMFINNQLEFLEKLAGAFQGISIELEKVTKLKEAS